MADKSYQDKGYSYSLKQEPFDGFSWQQLGDDQEETRNPPYYPKFIRNNQPEPFNSLTINNVGLDNDTLSLYRPNLPQTLGNDNGEQSMRNNSLFPGFDEGMLSRTNNNLDISQSGMNKFHPTLDLAPNFRTFPAIQNSISYFQLGVNGVRRPLPPDFVEEEPIYVNPKQYERIMKIRIKKAKKGIIKNPTIPQEKNKDGYKHESRHLHAKRRERGNGGRFLSKAEIEKKKEEDMKIQQHSFPLKADQPESFISNGGDHPNPEAVEN